MRAHSQRRLIWILNFFLGAALLAVAAWYALDVRKAVADTSYLKPAFANEAVEAFQGTPAATQNALKPPVSLKELDEIDRPEFKPGGRHFHWLYSGPLPPPPPEAPKVEKAKLPVISDLEKLGSVHMLIYYPPREGEEIASGSVLSWKFKSQAIEEFKPGQFLKDPKGSTPSGVKLVDIRRKGRYQFEIVYDVYEDPEGQPVSRGTFAYDSQAKLDQALQDRITFRKAAPAAGEGAAAESGATGETVAIAGEAGEPSKVTVVGGEEAAAGAEESEELKPEVEWENRNNARVEFDQKTYDYFRKQDPDEIAKSVKTQVARDTSGKVIGLEITGISPNSPADKFDIKRGDVLVSINGKPVASRSDAINLIQGMDSSVTMVTVVIDRLGRKITYNIDPRDPKVRREARELDNFRNR